jgi:hypothetical protein
MDRRESGELPLGVGPVHGRAAANVDVERPIAGAMVPRDPKIAGSPHSSRRSSFIAPCRTVSSVDSHPDHAHGGGAVWIDPLCPHSLGRKFHGWLRLPAVETTGAVERLIHAPSGSHR